MEVDVTRDTTISVDWTMYRPEYWLQPPDPVSFPSVENFAVMVVPFSTGTILPSVSVKDWSDQVFSVMAVAAVIPCPEVFMKTMRIMRMAMNTTATYTMNPPGPAASGPSSVAGRSGPESSGIAGVLPVTH
jgi:hypothetical protein